MQVGKKAQGHDCPIEKLFVVRHGNGGHKRAADAEERTIERRVRRAGKKEIAREVSESSSSHEVD